jgi:hypothetical protein
MISVLFTSDSTLFRKPPKPLVNRNYLFALRVLGIVQPHLVNFGLRTF